jgi:hypothetical protein
MASSDVARVREQMTRRGLPAAELSDDQIRSFVHQMAIGFRDNAPMSAEQAATIILDGVRRDAWRILVGDDAHVLDRLVRESPETAYDKSFVQALREQGHMQLLD